MKIDHELILKLEKLARLKLSEDQRSKMIEDLNDMLKMVNKLDELDLHDVEPLLHLSNQYNVTRTDKVEDHMDRDAALANAPDSDNEYFKVPKVIKK
ncbi:MAG: Asp-tRNA(Asn)/Glu-tRNA(Gln) amidotransferase subunit GatC [Bacteroidia bacterium]|nr:Asp-tRNA(Asn)/Glu-tRNA(Gln) amidotransferase subunit GatC [Bacteroidia bacterium]